jgi:hypothetical protein
MNELSQHVPSYNMTEYSALREFVMKTSLCPLYSFVVKSYDEKLRRIVKALFDKKLLEIEYLPEPILLFDVKKVKLGEASGRSHQENEEKA